MALLHAYLKLKHTAESNYPDIIRTTRLIGGKTSDPNKLRIYFINGSFLDIWLTLDGDYSYHWESTLQNGMIHRWDNAPDYPKSLHFQNISTKAAVRMSKKALLTKTLSTPSSRYWTL